MKTAPITFRKNGWTYLQLERVGDVALYNQGGGSAYEVVVIRRHSGFVVSGKRVEPAEYLPSNEDWGIYGWTLHTLEEAKAKMAVVIQDRARIDENRAASTSKRPSCVQCQRCAAAA